MQPRNRLIACVIAAVGILAASPSARADCANPPGPEGRLVYNSTYKVMQYCNGTQWVAAGGGVVDPRIGTLDAGKWCSSDGSSVSCTADAPVTIAGSDKQVIFNDGGAALAGASQLFWDKTNNRLGIGTPTPAARLHLAGPGGAGEFDALRLTKGSGYGSGTLKINYTNDSTGLVHLLLSNSEGDRATLDLAADTYSASGNPTSIRFTTAAIGQAPAERMRISSSGNVGIGSASPSGKLTIETTGGQHILFTNANAAGNYSVRLGNSGSLFFSVDGAERIRFNQDGYVGIGTLAPSSRLHVLGGVQMGDDTDDCPGPSNVKLGTMRYSAGAFSVCLAGGWTPLATGTGMLAAGATGQIQFNGGSGAFAADAALHWDNSTKRLGIGTATPEVQLHLASSAAAVMRLDSGVNKGRLVANSAVGGGFWIQSGLDYTNGSVDDIIFSGMNGTPRHMTIKGDTGNVGVGTITPASRLHVAGAVQLGNDTEDCPGTGNIKLGAMRYSAGAFSVCLAGGWTPLAAGALAAGSTGQIQFNGGSGNFAADSTITWDNTGKSLIIGSPVPALPTNALTIDGGTDSSAARSSMLIRRNASIVAGPILYLHKTRSGGQTLNGDNLGNVIAVGTAPGGEQIETAHLAFYASGNTTTTSQGGTIVFRTKAQDTTTFQVRMLIDHSGNVGIGTVAPLANLHVSGKVRLDQQTGDGVALEIVERGTGFGGKLVWLDEANTISAAITKTSSDNLAFYTGGAHTAGNEKLAITSDGNVGVGTVPEARLQVHGSATGGNITSLLLSQGTTGPGEQNSLVFKVSTHYGAAIAMESLSTTDFDMVFKTNTSGGNNLIEKMRITHDGKVGIGTATPLGKLHILPDTSLNSETIIDGWTSANTDIDSLLPGSTGGSLILGPPHAHMVFALRDNDANDGFYFLTTNTSYGTDNSYDLMALAIKSNGNVGIGTSSPSHLLHVAGVARSTQANFATSSDRRVKENIHSIGDGLATVMLLNPVAFIYTPEYRADNDALAGVKRGFIAQEVEAVLPELVTQSVEQVGARTIEDFRVLNNSDFVPLLVSAIKELKAANDNQAETMERLRLVIEAQGQEIERLKTARQ